MKDFAKSIVGNTKAGNSNKAEIIEKKKKEGATLKVDNGQKLEFSDGSTYVKTSFSDDYREAHNYTGNSRAGNELTSYEKAKKSDLEKRLKKEEQLLEDAKKMLRSKLSDDDRIGFQMQKEECEKNVSRLKEEIRKIGNSKVGNGLSDSYEFLMSAGKNDYNSIKEEVKKAGGWTPEIKAKARKTSDTLKKKAKELVETAHKQSAELEKLAGDIDSI